MTSFWIDVDNPPQAQYLSSIVSELRKRGHYVLLTSRAHTQTIAVLANRDETPLPIGHVFGGSRGSKVAGTMLRAGRLVPAVYRRIGIPRAVLSTSRSGVMAARMLGSKCFTILDYEGVETLVYRTFGTTVLHPEVIPASEFSALGFPEHRLVSFPGLKEDISFSGMNLTKVRPAELPSPRDPRLPAILVRPPSETSHYRVNASSDALGRILDHLADRSDAQVVFAPRESKQEQMLSARQWSVPPVLLRQPIPLVDLLRSVDRVLTGGGTMLREAAWFGVPTVTVFQGALPYVDRWLESEGRIERIGPSDDPAKFQWQAELERRAEGSVNGASLETVVKALES